MDAKQEMLEKVKVLDEQLWGGRAHRPVVESWLENFNVPGNETHRERLHALFLLSNFMYFGSKEMRELIKALYRDLFRYPIIANIRRSNNDTTDCALIDRLFQDELDHTRFIGVGNPSESGCHLLYYLRQENALPKSLFIHTHEIFERYGRAGAVGLRDRAVRRYVFIDDFCGSGEQGVNYSKDILEDLKVGNPDCRTAYYVLFGTLAGLQLLRQEARFDSVEAVFELDDSFRCFADASRFFVHKHDGITREFAHQMCQQYGNSLQPDHPLGFEDGQMLIGFHHNIPDNTLPIIWHSGRTGVPWKPMFRRYPKIYG